MIPGKIRTMWSCSQLIFSLEDIMQVIVIGEKGQHYLSLLEFCATRGIELVEEKINSQQQTQPEICESHGSGCGYMRVHGECKGLECSIYRPRKQQADAS